MTTDANELAYREFLKTFRKNWPSGCDEDDQYPTWQRGFNDEPRSRQLAAMCTEIQSAKGSFSAVPVAMIAAQNQLWPEVVLRYLSRVLGEILKRGNIDELPMLVLDIMGAIGAYGTLGAPYHRNVLGCLLSPEATEKIKRFALYYLHDVSADEDAEALCAALERNGDPDFDYFMCNL